MQNPISTVYIDTSIIINEGLFRNFKLFSAFTSKFDKKELHILIPSLMERELLRKLSEEADRLAKISTSYEIKKTVLKLKSQKELKEEFHKELLNRWVAFKEIFEVHELPCEKNLDVVLKWYFRYEAPFTKADNKNQKKEFIDAFIISALDRYQEKSNTNIAVISSDSDFSQPCEKRQHFYLFQDLKDYLNSSNQNLSSKRYRLSEDVKLSSPVLADDLKKLEAILDRGGNVSQTEISYVLTVLRGKGSRYDFFFKKVKNPVWFKPLLGKGFFNNPPDITKNAEGQLIMPEWPPLYYLIRMSDTFSDEVLEVISKFPSTRNFRILEGIIRIVINTDSIKAVSENFRFITSYVDNFQYNWRGHNDIIKLLKKPFFFDSKLSDIIPALLLKIVEFQRDDRISPKKSFENDPTEGNYRFKLVPHFDSHDYIQILENGVRHLAKNEPYKVSRILIDAVAGMIRLNFSQEYFERGTNEDNSEIWCGRIRMEGSNIRYRDLRGDLIQTLTFACEQVFRKSPESIVTLDQALRNYHWKVFQRLRQYLYAIYPSDQTLPWIREQILENIDYSNYIHLFEFQLMIRSSIEHFGPNLLNKKEKEFIFEKILEGPPKENLIGLYEENDLERVYQYSKRDFHRKQLRPFETILTGEIKGYYAELIEIDDSDPITDDSYPPLSINPTVVGSVKRVSPKSYEELLQLKDEELINYLNEVQQDNTTNDFVITSVSELGSEFQTLFKSNIVTNSKRFKFWMNNRDQIKQPIFITNMVKTMLEFVQEKKIAKLDEWFEFCYWVLEKSDYNGGNTTSTTNNNLSVNPSWIESRSAVVDFIDTCINQDVEIPISKRDHIAKLLRLVCNQYNKQLDEKIPTLLNRNDSIIEAINNTRSRSIRTLMNFGYWIRRNVPNDNQQEVTEILSERFSRNATFQLTRPEKALLGVHFGDLYILNKNWAVNKQEVIFPKDNLATWIDIFGNFIKYNQPYEKMYETLRREFEFALENLKSILEENKDGKLLIDRIGQYLFTYYVWGIFQLEGNQTLLKQFYSKTNSVRIHWSELFNFVGRSLNNNESQLEQTLKDQIIKFFDWRFEVGEPMELIEFTYWLKAKSLNPKWRLQSYSKILDLGYSKANSIYEEVISLAHLLPENTDLVVECFAKLVSNCRQETQFYMPSTEVKTILKAGLNEANPKIQEDAKLAQSNLLKMGRFEYLNID